jgi:HPt (histidine-containing phosphotransfer) domain-containing protein
MIEAHVKPTKHISAPPLVPGSTEAIIDRAHLARMTLGDKNLEGEVLALFERQADLLLARMANAPPAVVAAFAHTLKGSARGIGVWKVAKAAEAVERAASGASPTDFADAVAQLAATIGAVRAAIGDLLAAR